MAKLDITRSVTIAGNLRIETFQEDILGIVLRNAFGVREVRVLYGEQGEATIWVTGNRNLDPVKDSLARLPYVIRVSVVDDPSLRENQKREDRHATK